MASILQSPGVKVNEIDKSLGLNLVGSGGIGIAVKLNKGQIGVPLNIVSEDDLIGKGGLPITNFNLMGWHSVSNILRYAENVTASRVENLEFDAKHNTSMQKFEIPTNNAQIGICLSGDGVSFDFDSELQDMIKNRETFKTVNEQNEFDVLNPDTGINISEIDGAMLIDNDDNLEDYVLNNSFNTKAKSLKLLPKLGHKSITKDMGVPELEEGQVYNHNGKIVNIGNNIYDNYILLEITNGTKKAGTGTFKVNVVDDTIVEGTGTSFLSELKVGSLITATFFGAFVLANGGALNGISMYREATNFKKLTFSADVSGTIEAGDKIVVSGVERLIASVDSVDGLYVILTTDAPSTWGTVGTPLDNTDWGYKLATVTTEAVVSIVDDTTLTIATGSGISSSSDSTFEYLYVDDSATEESGIDSTAQYVYRDETDTTNKTLIGVNINFHTFLRVGSKIVVNIDGTNYVRYVDSIPTTGTNKVILTEAFDELTIESVDAKPFKYANFYFNTENANIGKKIFGAGGGVGEIVVIDETNNSPSSTLRYVVKIISGSFSNGEETCLAKLNADEWDYYYNPVYRKTSFSKDNNIYMIKYENSPNEDLDLERDNTIYFNTTITPTHTASAKVLMATRDEDDETTVLNVVIEILDDTSGETINVGDKFAITANESNTDDMGTVDFIYAYDDVVIYEVEDLNTGEMVMVNETVAGLTSTVKNRYTYSYNYTGTLADAENKQSYLTTDTVTGNSLASTEFMRIFAMSPGAWVNDDNIQIAVCDMNHYNANDTVDGTTKFSSLFEFAPDTTDKTLFCVVVIQDNLVVEKYIVSTDPNSKDNQNASQYAPDVINRKSSYIRIILNTSVFTPNVAGGYNIYFNTMQSKDLDGGYSSKLIELYRNAYYASSSTVNQEVTNGYVSTSSVFGAYGIFENVDELAIAYLVDGEWAGNATIANKLIEICVNRGDCVAILGPDVNDIVGIKDTDTIKNNILSYVNDNSLIGGNRFNQFGGFFANCKQIYDVYNETYVWLPISVDVVGLNYNVDTFFEVWYAVAGINRGAIRNIVKLGWNPTRLQRDELYPNRINPVVYFKGEGTYVYGVRTLCSIKSDLADMYNRKTLNHISKNLARFMRQVLFEFNDAITRGQVVNNIEPFLRNITAKSGLIDYKIVCDETNNGASVVEQNKLVCTIYLKMAHVIETVELNFVITKASVSFDEATI